MSIHLELLIHPSLRTMRQSLAHIKYDFLFAPVPGAFQNKKVLLYFILIGSLLVIAHQFSVSNITSYGAISDMFSPCGPGIIQFQNSSIRYGSTVLKVLPIDYENVTRTIYICRGSTDLTRISSVLDNQHLLNLTSDKNWFLNANILVMGGATLFINSTDTDWLKINSTAGPAYSIVLRDRGNLVIDHSKITSWDSKNKDEAKIDLGYPRAYLLSRWDGGQMNITNSTLSSLGYVTLDRFGDIMGNTTGIAYFGGDGSIIKNNTISLNYRGFYSSNASDIRIENNTIRNSHEYGLDPHTRSRNFKIIGNNIYNNGHHGIICSKSCVNMIIERNTSYNNSGHGIMLDQLVTNSNVANNVVYSNKLSGIAVWNSSLDIIRNNFIYDNPYGLIVTHMSHNNMIKNNIIRDSDLKGIYVYSGSTNNIFDQNTVTNSIGDGVYFKDSNTQNNEFIDNTVSKGSSYGIKFSNASNNRLVNNMLTANKPYDYYAKFDSSNTIINTKFNYTTLRFFDNSSKFILENTDNKIIGSNKKIPTLAYPTHTKLVVSPLNKNIITKTLNMVVIPFSDHVSVSTVVRNTNNDQDYRSWLQMMPNPKIRTGYSIGGLTPNTQFVIQTNGSIWGVRTANSSGFINFIYDGHDNITEFKVRPASGTLMQIWILLILIVSLVVFFMVKNSVVGMKDRTLFQSS